jgi:hypothetical protein
VEGGLEYATLDEALGVESIEVIESTKAGEVYMLRQPKVEKGNEEGQSSWGGDPLLGSRLSLLIVCAFVIASYAPTLAQNPISTTNIPTEVGQHLARGVTFFEERKLEEALAEAREALHLEPANEGAKALLMLVQMTMRTSSKHDVPLAEVTPPRREIVLKEGTQLVFRLLENVSSESRNQESNPVLQLVEDVKIGDFVVIPRESAIEYSVEKDRAGDLTQPGVVLLQFSSVRSITGEKIPVAGVELSAGTKMDLSACEDPYCVVLGYVMEHSLPGHLGRLQRDTLVAGYVENDIAFDSAILDALNQDLRARWRLVPKNTPEARLHIYFAASTPRNEEYGNTSTGIAVHIDGAKIGGLKPRHYACTEVPAGAHVLRVGKTSSQITVERGKDYFLRLERADADVSMTLREGYEIYDRLVSGTFRKGFAVDCWKD